MNIPGTAFQLAALFLVVMPGIVYLAVQHRFHGPTPESLQTGNRVLRAVMVSAVFDSLYLMALGPHFVWLVRHGGSSR
jgi:hypothetical protein